jgi:CYTH domain-containing protein
VAYEIERKFLLRVDPRDWPLELLAPSAAEITQGYVNGPADSVEVRVRKVRAIDPDTASYATPQPPRDPADRQTLYLLAIKGRIPTTTTGGISRHEFEVLIPQADFEQAWRIAGSRHLRKVRVSYAFRDGDGEVFTVSVDSFRDRHRGLVIAEFEFDNWDDSVAFVPPPYVGAEVTHDRRFRNAVLAESSAPPEG